MSVAISSHPFVDAVQPSPLERTFSEGLPPLIRFGNPIVETIDGLMVHFDPRLIVTRDIVIADSTFREGQQARRPYTLEQTVRLYSLLAKLGGPRGVIRQSEFALSTKNDREGLDRCRALGKKYPECIGWIRATKDDIRLAKAAGIREAGILLSCSDYHIFNTLKFASRRECLERYCEVVAAAFDAGLRPRCDLEDVTRADVEGFVLPLVDRLMELSSQVAPEFALKIRLCDTLGLGVSYPGVELPRSISKLIYKLTRECEVPGRRLEWRGSNAYHAAHVNGTAAWLYGCDVLNATLFGGAGNAPLENAVMEYLALKGEPCGINTAAIAELADYARALELPLPDNYPALGRCCITSARSRA